MKRFVFILITIGFSINLSAQDRGTGSYFHELVGMEDSSGTSHLFYRTYVAKSMDCQDMGGYSSSINKIQNHIYHFDTSTIEDSVKLEAYNFIYPRCFQEWRNIEQFIFTGSHPDSIFAVKSTIRGLSGSFYFPIKEEHRFSLNVGNPVGISFDEELNEVIVTTPFYFMMIKAKYFEEELSKKSFRYPLSNDSTWLNYEHIGDLPDSLFIDFTVMGVNPYKEGHYVGLKDSNIVLSTDHGSTFKPITQIPKEWDPHNLKLPKVHFDADSSSFFFKADGWKVYLVKKESTQWSIKNIAKNHQHSHFASDADQSGSYYFSQNDSLLYSADFGETTVLKTTFSHPITGLYKKPDSNILYVLTKEELFELNVATKEIISLKKLPVSSEHEPTFTPQKVTLEQNYPNPFNPSTVIRYQLSGNSLVRLEVFDITGRKVATLVDGKRQSAGTHQVTFDAGTLSSGMYFYRLQSGGQTITQKMMLVK